MKSTDMKSTDMNIVKEEDECCICLEPLSAPVENGGGRKSARTATFPCGHMVHDGCALTFAIQFGHCGHEACYYIEGAVNHPLHSHPRVVPGAACPLCRSPLQMDHVGTRCTFSMGDISLPPRTITEIVTTGCSATILFRTERRLIVNLHQPMLPGLWTRSGPTLPFHCLLIDLDNGVHAMPHDWVTPWAMDGVTPENTIFYRGLVATMSSDPVPRITITRSHPH